MHGQAYEGVRSLDIAKFRDPGSTALGERRATVELSVPFSPEKKLFLTGASGMVGRAMLRLLPPDHVMALTHRATISEHAVETVAGDVRAERLGLTVKDFGKLSRRIGCVVHAAADTNLVQSASNLFNVNVDGTRHVLDLAEAAGVPFYFVSTGFVAPVRHLSGAPERNAYELSKIGAEDLVRQRGHPATIVRPSVIIGDSTTGEIDRCQGFHQIVDLVLQRRLPILPVPGDGYIDFVPRDVVADAILTLVRAGVVDRDVWLTAGPQAPRLRDVLAVVVSTAARVFGRPMAMPRLIQGVDGARFLSTGPVSRRVAYRQLFNYAKYLSTVEALPTSFADLPYDPEATLAANVRYWCERAEAPGNLARSA